MVVLKIKGHQILEALENGVSKYPSLEGRCENKNRQGQYIKCDAYYIPIFIFFIKMEIFIFLLFFFKKNKIY